MPFVNRSKHKLTLLHLLLRWAVADADRFKKVFVILLTGCLYASPLNATERDNVDTISAHIEQALDVGDSKEKVDSFLRQTSWLYTYDVYAARYQATPRDATTKCHIDNLFLWLLYDCRIQIYLNFDPSGRYSGFSVKQTYSGL